MVFLSGCLQTEQTQVSLGEEFLISATIQKPESQKTPTNSQIIEYRVTFSKPIDPSTFTTDDIQNLGTAQGVSWFPPTPVNVENSEFTITTALINQEGTVAPFIPEDAVSDADGLKSQPSNSGGALVVLYDHTAPLEPQVVTLAAGQPGYAAQYMTRTPGLVWSPSSDQLSGVKRYEAQVRRKRDGFLVSDWTPLNYQKNYLDLPDLNYGLEYQVFLRALDHAGNTSSEVDGPSWFAQLNGWKRFFDDEAENKSILGRALALSETWAVLGFYENSLSGTTDGIVILKKVNGRWQKWQTILAQSLDTFGSVVVTEDVLVVSLLPSPVSAAIEAIVFGIDPISGQWQQTQRLTATVDFPPPPSSGNGLPFTYLSGVQPAVANGRIFLSYTPCILNTLTYFGNPGLGFLWSSCLNKVEVFSVNTNIWSRDLTLVADQYDSGIPAPIYSRPQTFPFVAADGDHLIRASASGAGFVAWKREGTNWVRKNSIPGLVMIGALSGNRFVTYGGAQGGQKSVISFSYDDLSMRIWVPGPTVAINLLSNDGALALKSNKVLAAVKRTDGLYEIKAYTLNQSTWQESWSFHPPDSYFGDKFGFSLVMNSTEFLISANNWGNKFSQALNRNLTRGAVYLGLY